MNRSLAISASLHVLIIAIGLIGFGKAVSIEAPLAPSMPVDIMSVSDFTQMTRGQRNAPKAETPRQVAEKIADVVQPPDSEAKKISEKPPIDTSKPPPMPPKVERPPEPKAEAKPEPKPEAKPDPKPEPKQAEVPTPPQRPKPAPTPPSRPPERAQQQQPPAKVRNYDSSQIAALLDQRDPTRQASSGRELSRSASLGDRTGGASVLSQSIFDAVGARIHERWQPPQSDRVVRFEMTLYFRPDGTFAREPSLQLEQNDTGSMAMAQTAMRAAIAAQPFSMLPRDRFREWESFSIAFCTPEFALECRRR